MKRLLSLMLSAALGLWLATTFIPGAKATILPESNFFGFTLTATWQLFILLGIALGLLNYFVKPILNVITLPLRIITLGLFGFVINMGLIWVVDVIFEELNIPLFYPLFWTALIIWLLNIIISKILIKKEEN